MIAEMAGVEDPTTFGENLKRGSIQELAEYHKELKKVLVV